MSGALRDACAKYGIAPADLDLIVPHQANLRIIQSAAKDLGLPLDRFFQNIETCGNTSSACIPVGLAQLDEQGALTEGKTVGLVGFGAGLVYGGCVFEL
jgi:3-oxoacyl-[acyl-carrier-protein] synthase-3